MRQAFIRCRASHSGLVWEIYDRQSWERIGEAATAQSAIATAVRLGYLVD